MDDYALVLNAGSSSLKFCVYRRPAAGDWALSARGQVDGIGTAPTFTEQAPDLDLSGQPGTLAASTVGEPPALTTPTLPKWRE